MVRIGEKGDIPIDPSVPRDQAKQTITSLLDGVVELVTNSDDSYVRMESQKRNHKNRIEIVLKRLKLGKWEFLSVVDYAEGMDLDALLGILKYGGKTSGFSQGLAVRGLWGRGLKETILAIGNGEIASERDGQRCKVKVWWDKELFKGRWEVLEEATPTPSATGKTQVTVCPDEDCDIKAPEFDTFYSQISGHYALRNVVQKRDVWLTVEFLGGRGGHSNKGSRTKQVTYQRPEGRLCLEETVTTGLGVSNIRVWESEAPLPYRRRDPCSLAGLVVETEGVPVDISLFGFEGEEAARFFFGVVACDGIAKKIREGSREILTTARTGLAWKHRLCQELELAVGDVLKPLVLEKKQSLSRRSSSEIPQEKKRGLLSLLNKIAREEVEGILPDMLIPDELTHMVIKPDPGYGEPGIARTFSVYLPKEMSPGKQEPIVALRLSGRQGNVTLSESSVSLRSHPAREDILRGTFAISGEKEGDKSYIVASSNSEEAVALFMVAASKGRGKRQLRGKGGGFFRDIKADDMAGPSQRAERNDDGDIIVYRKFPGVWEILGIDSVPPETPQGKTLYSELILEAVCRTIARKRLDDGRVSFAPGGEIDAFNAEVIRLMQKCMFALHYWVAKH